MSTSVEAPVRMPPEAPLGRADAAMRRLLFLPAVPAPASAADARKAFRTSILVTTVRCLLLYIFLPFVAPALGLAAGVGPALGLVIGLVAAAAIVTSIRRFWRASHPKRWHYTALGGVVLGFLVYLAATDLAALLS
jgi:hypothetical protein